MQNKPFYCKTSTKSYTPEGSSLFGKKKRLDCPCGLGLSLDGLIYNKVGKLELRTGKFIFPSLRRSCIYTWSKINLNCYFATAHNPRTFLFIEKSLL